jgi:hypothetical protein
MVASKTRRVDMSPELHFVEIQAVREMNLAATARASARIKREVWPSDVPAGGVVVRIDGPAVTEVPVTQQLHLYWQPGRFWREEISFQNDTVLTFLYSPTQAAAYSAAMGFSTSAPRFSLQPRGKVDPGSIARLESVFPVTVPEFPADEWRIESSDVERLERPAVQVRATRIDTALRPQLAEPESGIVWQGCDAYQYVRDAEYGFLLEYIAYENGNPAASTKIVSLRINEPFPAHIDSLRVPWHAKRRYGVCFG